MIFLNKKLIIVFKTLINITYMRFGSFSILLNENEYSTFGIKPTINDESKPLFKITYLKEGNMGDIKYSDILIKQNDYIVKIYKENMLIDLNNKSLINYLKNGIEKYDEYKVNNLFTNILYNSLNLTGYFLENLGDFDLFDSLKQLIELDTNNIWIIDTNKRINEFIIHMCEALEYLKDQTICHLDIKPENIVYNNRQILIPFGKRFKLVDFGFADKYPFTRYANKVCGSINYVPYYTSKKDTYSWIINNKTNDWLFNPILRKYIHYIYRYNASPELIYKTDIYSMGVVFNQLIYYLNYYMKHKKLNFSNNREIKNLIEHMTHKDIILRFYPSDCIKYLDTSYTSYTSDTIDNSDTIDTCPSIFELFNCCKK